MSSIDIHSSTTTSSSRRTDSITSFITTTASTSLSLISQEEYEAQLKQILEHDSSDEELYNTLVQTRRNLSTSPSAIDIKDLDLDIDFAVSTSPDAIANDLVSRTATSAEPLSSSSPQGHSIFHRLSPLASPSLATTTTTTITISEPVVEEEHATLHIPTGNIPTPSPPREHLNPTGLLSPSLTATSSTSSIDSTSKRIITRTTSIASNTLQTRHVHPHSAFFPSPPREGHFLHRSNQLLHRGQNSTRVIPPLPSSTGSNPSTTIQTKRPSQLSVKMNGQQRSTSSRTGARAGDRLDDQAHDKMSIPIILKGAHSRLVNGLQSITSLEQQFNELRIPELELINTPESTIRAVLADIYKISEELHMHLQGGPLSDNPIGLNRKEVNGVVISDGSQRQRRIKELMERISRETSVYEEFVKQSSYLNLDAILNEASDDADNDDQDDDELLSLNRADRDASELDSTSDFHHEDTLSQTSFMSSHSPQHHMHLSTSMSISSPISPHPYRSGSADPLQRLRLHPHRYASPGSVASSSFTGHRSRASSASFSISELNRSDTNITQSPGGGPSSSSHAGTGRVPGGAEPWETFRWTPLVKLSEHLYSEDVKASLGLGTCIAVSSVIAVGTSRGTVLVYNGNQGLVGVFGTAQYAVEHGSVCSVAISSDHNYVAAGYSLGSILVWNLTKPPTTGPSRIIPPVNRETALSGRKVGHLRGSAVLHVNFVGIKHNEIASADDQGMSFHHLLYKVMMVHAVETTRLLGKYPPPRYPKHYEDKNASSPRRSTIFEMGVLPYGQAPHPADNAGLVALLTPFKMLIVCIKPKAQTLFKYVKPKEVLAKEGEAATVASGSLAWLPAMKAQRTQGSDMVQDTPPMLACSWNRHLYLFQVHKTAPLSSISQRTNAQQPNNNKGSSTSPVPFENNNNHANSNHNNNQNNIRHARLEFIKTGDWMCRDNIVGIQWVKPQILLLLTNSEEVIVFDPRLMCETERCSIRSLQIVYHDWFKDAFKALQSSAAAASPVTIAAIADAKSQMADMSYNNSWRIYKSKLFVLGVHRLQVGTILNWTDRILALVKSGDFLEGIALATLFYTGKSIQAAVVGLPEDEATRHQLVGEKIYELLTASLNYSFNAERMQDVALAMADSTADIGGGVGAGTVLFHDLAIQCIESCLAMNDQDFLFDEVYERYAEAGNETVKGIFLQSLEPYILRDKITEMPPQVMQAFVKHYSSKGMYQALEQCICHIPCHVLEMDQIVDLCQRHRLYTALIHVWNKSIGDYVSPVVELLKVIKKILKARKGEEGGGHGAALQDATITPDESQHSQQDAASSSSGRDQWTERMSDEEAVQKLYKYLADSLLGRSFTDGTPLDDQEAVAAKESLYSFIFSGHCVMWPKTGGQLIITGEQEDEVEPTYPYLRLFLRHDCDEFLKVLDMAFEDSYLNSSSDAVSMANGRDTTNGDGHSRRTTEDEPSKVVSKQLIINTLLEVFTPSAPFGTLSPSASQDLSSLSSSSSSSFHQQSVSSPSRQSQFRGMNSSGSIHSNHQDEYTSRDFAHLYSFVARNYAKSSKSIVLSPTTLHRILTRLSSDTDPKTREERQVAAQALLRHYSPGDDDAMMKLYEKAGFYRVLEKMYRAQKQYGAWVMTFLNDPDRRSQVFEAIQKLLGPARSSSAAHSRRRGGQPITEKQRTDVVKTVMDHIAEVVDIDGEQAALLVHKYLNAEHRAVLRTLQGSKPRLFAYLRGLLEPSSLMERRAAAEEAVRRQLKLREHGLDDATGVGSGEFAMDLLNSAVHAALENDDDDPATMIGAQAITDPEMHEIYIELMCEYDPTSIYDYLERHQDNSYRLDKVLGICEKAGVVDAVVWILERSGNVNGALTKVLEIVQDRMDTVTQLVAAKPKDQLQDAHWSMEDQNTIRASLVRLRGVLNVGKQLCERSSKKAKVLRNNAAANATTTTTSGISTAVSPPLSTTGTERETESLWFRLLQTFVTASRKMTLLVGDVDVEGTMGDHHHEAEGQVVIDSGSVEEQEAAGHVEQSSRRHRITSASGHHSSLSKSNTSGAAALSMIENAPPTLFSNTSEESNTSYHVVDQVVNSFKGYVQSILTTLLLSTSTPQVSLPSLLRRLIQSQEDAAAAAAAAAETTVSSPASEAGQESLSHIRNARFADFREIFLGMLDTYKYEGQLLEMTNNLFERDLFLGVRQVVKTRAKGWRPRKRNCEICGGAFWGPDIIRDLWVQQQRATAAGIKAALATKVTSNTPDPNSMASSSSSSTASPVIESSGTGQVQEANVAEKMAGKDLILFRCGHGYHRSCLQMETLGSSGTDTGNAGSATGGSGASSIDSRPPPVPPKDDPHGKAPVRSTETQTASLQYQHQQQLACAMCNGLVKGPRAKSPFGLGSNGGSQNTRYGQSHHRRSRRRDLGSGWELVPRS